jgi:hypothetical protein
MFFNGGAVRGKRQQTVKGAAQEESAANAHGGRLLGSRRQSILDFKF